MSIIHGPAVRQYKRKLAAESVGELRTPMPQYSAKPVFWSFPCSEYFISAFFCMLTPLVIPSEARNLHCANLSALAIYSLEHFQAPVLLRPGQSIWNSWY